MTTNNPFEHFHALGYRRLIPIVPPDAKISERSSLFKRVGTKQDGRGKTPGARGRDGNWSGFDWLPYEADTRDLHRWHTMRAGVGIKTGNGLIAIDADTLDNDRAKIIRDTIEQRLGRLPIRVGQYPKALYLCRVDGPFQYSRIEFGERDDKDRLLERVEILSDGRQFVAHGTHPKTGKPYEWPRDIIPFDQLPIFRPEQITALLEALRPLLPQASPVVKEGATTEVNQDALKGRPDHVRKAVAAIPNTSALFPSRESYRDMGYAIKASLPDDEREAFDIYSDWCERWTDGSNDPDIVAADWRRMKPPYRRGAGWLYELAEAHGDGQFSNAEIWFEEIVESDNPFAVIEREERAERPKRRYDFLTFDDAANSALSDFSPPLIKGLLDQNALSVMYGDSNVGKTFVAMDVAYHIATGTAYADMKTEHALVVYVAGEGGRGARRRMAALRDKFAPKDAPRVRLLPSSLDLRRPDADVGPFIEAVLAFGEPVGLIVMDTLSRALAGGDENSPVDMGALVTHADRVRQATGAHFMFIHHTGKDKAKGARGHSLLRAATDTEIEVGDGQILVTKQRDMDKSWGSGFNLEVRRLGIDPQGDAVTSCTVRLVSRDAAEAVRGETTAGEAAVLDMIATLQETSKAPEKGVKISEIMAYAADNMSGFSRDAINAHIRGLRQKQRVSQKKRGFWSLTDENECVDGVSECVESIFG